MAGGSANDGTISKLATTGHETVLHAFTGADGANPEAGLTLLMGNFYGITAGGGKSKGGIVFRLTASGQESVLH